MEETPAFEDTLNCSAESAAIESELNDIQLQIHEYRAIAVQAVEQNERHNRKKKKKRVRNLILCVMVGILIALLINLVLGVSVMLSAIALLTIFAETLIYKAPENYNAFIHKYYRSY